MSPPTILVVSMLEWAGPVAARVAMALHAAGFAVAVLAPPHDVVCSLRCPISKFALRPWAPKLSIRRALQRCEARLVVPCDDPTVWLLHQIHAEHPGDPSRSRVRDCIEASLGDPSSFRIARSKCALIEHACRMGIRVPDTRLVPNLETLESRTAAFAMPYLIKADGSWGGIDITLVHGTDEARAVFTRTTTPSWPRVVKRTIDRRSLAPLVAKIRQEAPTTTVQQYVLGRPAHRVVVCWKGEVLAGISCETLLAAPVTGPAAVVQLMEHTEMEDATARIVRSLRISGFCCCDFLIESGSERAFMLELNPRATQTCHLVPTSGKGLAVALFEHITSMPARRNPYPSVSGTVALFAREWGRDPASPYLQAAYHDVPWSEPDLVLACMHRERRRRWTDRVRNAIRGT